jgi:hypothetical protein
MTPTATHDTSTSTSSATPTPDLKVRGSEDQPFGAPDLQVRRTYLIEIPADSTSSRDR